MRVARLTAFTPIALLASAWVCAQQTPLPAAPQVTVGANIKELTFHWQPVPGAYTYWVLEKKDARSFFTPIGVRIPASRPRAAAPIAVHLQNWAESRYAIAACNSAGCTRSAQIDPQPLMPDVIGYFKASNTDPDDLFGQSVVLSADGSTMAVGAAGEASNSTGVNGNQADDSAPSSGAVYVFRREGRRWKQEAYLKGSQGQADQFFGVSNGFDEKAIAVSGDGSWVAVGSPGEDVDGVAFAGGVHIFRRATSGTWSHHSTLRSPDPIAGIANSFGYSVEFTEDGKSLKVNSALPRGEDDNYEGRTHVYDFNGATWQRTAVFGPPFPGYYCRFNRMSGDGTTMTSWCYQFPSEGIRLVTRKRSGNSWVLVGDQEAGSNSRIQALSFDGRTVALQEERGLDRIVTIYRWNGSVWLRDSEVPPPALTWPSWGHRVELNRGASMVAVSDFQVGAVALYERIGNAATPWALRSISRAPPRAGAGAFGGAISLSGNGRFLAVGAAWEGSDATGIDGDRFNTRAPRSGAVYLY